MFVGDTGISRIVERTCQLMKETDDVTKLGGLPLDMIQRSLNYWYSISLDLFGGEISSNASNYFAAGLKGRAFEMKKYTDHKALDGHLEIPVVRDGKLVVENVPYRNAMNEVLRDDYTEDNEKPVERWNSVLDEHGITGFRFKLPSQRFNRQIGEYANHRFDPEGNLVSQATWDANKDHWLINDRDRAYIASIQKPVTEPGKMANWIAPPKQGIKGRPVEFEYVRL